MPSFTIWFGLAALFLLGCTFFYHLPPARANILPWNYFRRIADLRGLVPGFCIAPAPEHGVNT